MNSSLNHNQQRIGTAKATLETTCLASLAEHVAGISNSTQGSPIASVTGWPPAVGPLRKGLLVRVLQTEEAVRLYNLLRLRMPVGALIHSTC